MKQIAIFLILILFSCKGQSVDTLEEIKNEEPITIEILGQKPNTDSLSVIIVLPKRYKIKSNQNLKLVDINYHKNPQTTFGTSGLVIGKEFVNLNDTIQFNIVYDGVLKVRDFNKIIDNQVVVEKKTYTITNNQALYQLLNVFKNDEILFKYKYLANPKELQVLSIPVNLE
ncbi:hypothetical protein [Empedobacter falsenii]|uniref:Uncharacterized protein n=1 Tax=Empedobacter falsenii TaxID=343874 RepID=A0AAW7DJI8_9FLAO|nr:hypothetical protein [Empedobacter falsenii]MDM1551690.1 hypothetical protein [Empedobacter falsenii]